MTNDQIELHSPEAVDLKMEIAGIGARSHAFIIDWHIRLLFSLAWLLAVGIALFSFQGLTQSAWENAPTTLLYLWLIPAGILYFFYHPALEILMSGRTPGKRMAGVKLVTIKGLTPSTGALLIRNVFRLLDSLPAFYILGLFTAALTKNQVRIGDLASGLVLVYHQDVSQKQLHRVSQLALNTHLNPDDQALLLQLLNRWQHLLLNDRNRLAEQFLKKIGEPYEDAETTRKIRSNNLLSRLQQLANAETS